MAVLTGVGLTVSPRPAPPPADVEKSFTASLDVVKLFTTLSTGALAFSIGLTSQATNNYPGAFHTAIIAGWLVFFCAIVAGLWAQMSAVALLKRGQADPDEPTFRSTASAAVGLFILGVFVLGSVLVFTAPHGAAGERLAVASPAQAIAAAVRAAGARPVARIAATEYLKGIDPVRPDQASWHVALELAMPAGKGASGPATVDVYVDPVSGCAYAVQLTTSAKCAGF